MPTTAPVFRLDPLPGGEMFTLAGSEGRHAATVRRIRAGERLDVTDGSGRALECEVVAVRRDELDCLVLRRTALPAPAARLAVVQALAKGDRGERAVEMLTEVGVDEIIPWSATRSVTRWEGERGERARTRWCRTAEEAAKQSRRHGWPVITSLAGTAEVARRTRTARLAVVLHEHATTPLRGLARSVLGAAGPAAPIEPVAPGEPPAGPGGTDVLLVVGPEGGITDAELAVLDAAGAVVARIGPTVLRTSTAGVVAAAVALADMGRLDG